MGDVGVEDGDGGDGGGGGDDDDDDDNDDDGGAVYDMCVCVRERVDGFLATMPFGQYVYTPPSPLF